MHLASWRLHLQAIDRAGQGIDDGRSGVSRWVQPKYSVGACQQSSNDSMQHSVADAWGLQPVSPGLLTLKAASAGEAAALGPWAVSSSYHVI